MGASTNESNLAGDIELSDLAAMNGVLDKWGGRQSLDVVHGGTAYVLLRRSDLKQPLSLQIDGELVAIVPEAHLRLLTDMYGAPDSVTVLEDDSVPRDEPAESTLTAKVRPSSRASTAVTGKS